ncbi:histidine decarboxylase [Acanthocystis turfacea Chlorella virus NE-JV-2]|nr:histidine decarboxylase [Acanthocystis turfacea Chlorella virus NE-JV-2]
MRSFARSIAIGYPCTLNRQFPRASPTLRVSFNNAGDPFAPEGTFDRHAHPEELKMLENVSRLWNVDINEVWGYTTSGGSEGNMQGLWIAREKYPNAVLYYSDQSHYSIKKIANILKIDSVVVPTTETGEFDTRKLGCLVDHGRPAIILANIGTTFLGAVDDVERIKFALAGKEDVYIHADAAFFGFVMPFLRPGYDQYKLFDSISVSCHKWPGVKFPSGVFMSVKDHPTSVENFEEVIAQRDVTVSGSRNGHAPFFMNEFLETVDLGKEVSSCLEMTEYMYNRLMECAPECKPWKNENTPILVFKSPSKELIKKWSLATVGKRSHVCVLSHVTKEIADTFIHDMAIYFGRRQGCEH